jgi:nucleotide-binding universal stress UspA family protein
MTRILLAVDDSPAALAAARSAIRLAVDTRAQLRVVHVLPGTETEHALEGSHDGTDVARRQESAAEAVLRYVAALATDAGLAAETRTLRGRPARTILGEAAGWNADLIVIGRAGGRHVGEHYVGSDVQRVLEFAEIPVLVVPA